ncbi:MAG: SRPBCC family protein [Burkholderiales bacterium]|nr:SRPBCC family protein [Burkholderiales bacterium]
MIEIVLWVVAAAVVVLLIAIAMRPAAFRVTRSATLPAPPASVFPHVNELRKWEAWSPWARLDPAAKSVFEGPDAGTGASMAWAGNRNLGEGRMTIVESRPAELVRFRLEFFKPFKATNSAEFTFAPEGGGTLVTWSMSGTNNFVAKAIGLVANCERMVGGQFEQGLSNMRAVVESPAAKGIAR